MSESKSQNKLDAAIELGFLSKAQVDSLESEQASSNYPALKGAIRKGFLNRKQLDILNIFAEPESVVPGYRIDGFLGEGGVGTVYKATQIRMDRPVAIKTIHRSAARNDLTPKRFEREAHIVGQLRHPNIIPAFDFGVHNEKLYLIMEYVDGIDAEKQLLKRSHFEEIHAWFIARQVCHALDNAHQLGIIHRDIKPGNLILTEAPAGTQMPAGVPFVKVADFGLAKFSDRQLDAAITLDQAISGTPFYMSPEQIQAIEIDHRSDIYSLGSTIWHLITGAPPISGNGPLDVITSKMKLEDTWMEPVGDMSQPGFQLLEKMCRHDRDKRMDDYSELSRAIDSVIEFLGELEPNAIAKPSGQSEFSNTGKVTTIREMAKSLVLDGPVENGATQDFLVTDQSTFNNSGTFTDSFAATESSFLQDVSGHSQVANPKIDEPAKPTKRLQSPVLWATLLLAGLILPAAIYFSPASDGGKAGLDNQTQSDSAAGAGAVAESRTRLSEFSGPPTCLFSGTEVSPEQRSSGTWEPAKGGEGESVLSGRGGFRNFRCRDQTKNPLKFYRFVCGFRHHESDLIKFEVIDGKSQDGDAEAFFSVVINPEMATLKSGEITEQCELQQFDDEQSFGYHQFRIESHPDHWRIELDNELLGEVDKPATFAWNDSLIQLSVQGQGSAHFEGIDFREYASQPDGN